MKQIEGVKWGVVKPGEAAEEGGVKRGVVKPGEAAEEGGVKSLVENELSA